MIESVKTQISSDLECFNINSVSTSFTNGPINYIGLFISTLASKTNYFIYNVKKNSIKPAIRHVICCFFFIYMMYILKIMC